MNKIILILFTVISVCFADYVRYNKIADLADTSGSYVAHHHHDWQKDTGFIELRDKTGNIKFSIASPAFTYLKIFEKSQMIVLLSKIKIDNPVQLEIIDLNGNILLKQRIKESNLNFKLYGISGSVTNYTFWYFEEKPKIQINEINGEIEIGIETPNHNTIKFNLERKKH